MRILYVEDHPANLFLVQRVARMGNHDIINYTEGQSALDHFDNDKPDLVLMDVQLPGKLTGLDVVRELRSRGHKLPIIAVTAYAMMGDRERCLEAGCDAYIAKPMPINDLVDILKKFDPTASAKPDSTPETDSDATSAAGSTPADEKPAASSTDAEAKPTATTEASAEQQAAETTEKPSEGSTPADEKPDVTTEASAEQQAAETTEKPAAEPAAARVPISESPVEATVKKLEAS